MFQGHTDVSGQATAAPAKNRNRAKAEACTVRQVLDRVSGKWAIGIYLGGAAMASMYGAASSLMAILVWVYYSALIFFLGAEFTYVYAHEYGSRRAHG